MDTRSSRVSCDAVDQIVVSAGPYRFHGWAELCDNNDAKSAGSASPPHKAFKPLSGRPPDPNSRRQVAGVACNTVAPLADSAACNAAASIATARLATTTRPPTSSGKWSSRPAMSKDRGVTDSTTSDDPI